MAHFPHFLWLSLAVPAAATEICGTLNLAADWTLSGSPYLVTGDVYIPPSSRLTIQAGVVVRFAHPRPCPSGGDEPQMDWSDSAYAGIKSEGALYILGTEEKPVVFEPASDGAGGEPGAIAWDGLRLLGLKAHRAEIAFAIFRGANQALYAERSGFYVHHCLFEGNNTGIYLARRGNVTVLNCNFIANRSAGLYTRESSPRIANNIFQDNRMYGIWSDGDPALRIQYNAFWASREEHCFHCPYPVLANPKQDTLGIDPYGNREADPVFLASPSHQKARQADLHTDTPPHLVKDAELAHLEVQSRGKWMKDASASGVSPHGAAPSASFKPMGQGLYLLSPYSSLIDAGLPGKDFRDRDGSRNDMGWHGGRLGRVTTDPF